MVVCAFVLRFWSIDWPRCVMYVVCHGYVLLPWLRVVAMVTVVVVIGLLVVLTRSISENSPVTI